MGDKEKDETTEKASESAGVEPQAKPSEGAPAPTEAAKPELHIPTLKQWIKAGYDEQDYPTRWRSRVVGDKTHLTAEGGATASGPGTPVAQ